VTVTDGDERREEGGLDRVAQLGRALEAVDPEAELRALPQVRLFDRMYVHIRFRATPRPAVDHDCRLLDVEPE
jgi:hypothetical protein